MNIPLITWFPSWSWVNILDIAVVAMMVYVAYKLLKGTGASKIFIGIIGFVVLWRLVDYLAMPMTASILGSVVNVGVIAIFIVFQPEIRRFLLLIGSGNLIERNKKLKFLKFFFKQTTEKLNIDAIVTACDHMAKTYTGALIVLAKDNQLEYPVTTGERLDAKISSQLLENIFYKNSPLHDGAVIISHNIIVAARCILPVSANPHISANLGLRHRSAYGVTEQTDAVAVVVSEQTGYISFVKSGVINRNLTPEKLRQILLDGFTEDKSNKPS